MITTTILATGRRKTSVASLRMQAGAGAIKVNGRDFVDFFPSLSLQNQILRPLEIANAVHAYDVVVKTTGGGINGQAGALRLALSRALIQVDESLRGPLKLEGLLTRDPRVVERKKYGKAKARRSFQFSKR